MQNSKLHFKIQNFTKNLHSALCALHSRQRRAGFTLIEILAASSVFMVIGTAVLSVLFVSLRASKKSDLLINLRQNGNSALTQMARQIRYANSLEDPISCLPPVNQSSITITSGTDSTETTFSCGAIPGTISSTDTLDNIPKPLVDTNSIAVKDCSFTCSQKKIDDPPTINLKFTMESKNVSGLTESNGSIPFQTSVTMRNSGR